jgi:acetyltransferase-like isoleucine patch superfamily enzyme
LQLKRDARGSGALAGTPEIELGMGMTGQEIVPRFRAEVNLQLDDGVAIGYGVKTPDDILVLGANCTIRMGSIIYRGVRAGDYLQTGHHVLVREHSRIGNHVVICTNSVIDGTVEIGDFVKIESNCYIPTHVKIGSRVFFGPGVVLTNDRYPLRQRDSYQPEGPVIEDDVTLGGAVTVCPGVRIGAGSFVAAGAIVTKDVPPESLVIKAGEIRPLPEKFREPNMALSWRNHLAS